MNCSQLGGKNFISYRKLVRNQVVHYILGKSFMWSCNYNTENFKATAKCGVLKANSEKLYKQVNTVLIPFPNNDCTLVAETLLVLPQDPCRNVADPVFQKSNNEKIKSCSAFLYQLCLWIHSTAWRLLKSHMWEPHIAQGDMNWHSMEVMLSNGQNKKYGFILIQSTFEKGKASSCCSWIADQTQTMSPSYLLINKLNVKSMVVILPSLDIPMTPFTQNHLTWSRLNAIWATLIQWQTIKHVAVYSHSCVFQIKM